MTLKEELGYGLDALVLFRGLQQNPVIHALMEFCHADSSDLANQIRTYSSIVAALYPATDNLTDYMEKIVLEEETVYVQRIGAGEAVSDAMKKCLETELHLLQKIAMLTSSQLQAEMPYFPDLPTWNNRKIDLAAAYHKRVADIGKHGYGVYAQYHMFTLDETGDIIPICYPDPIDLDHMVGYERERNIVIDNTKALLMTRAMVELCHLGERLGGDRQTFGGLAGMGDLIVTCTSMHSRNRRAGILIGQGKTPREAMEEVGAVVEGYFAAESIHQLSERVGVEMPISRCAYEVLYQGKQIRGVVAELMTRAKKDELLETTWL